MAREPLPPAWERPHLEREPLPAACGRPHRPRDRLPEARERPRLRGERVPSACGVGRRRRARRRLTSDRPDVTLRPRRRPEDRRHAEGDQDRQDHQGVLLHRQCRTLLPRREHHQGRRRPLHEDPHPRAGRWAGGRRRRSRALEAAASVDHFAVARISPASASGLSVQKTQLVPTAMPPGMFSDDSRFTTFPPPSGTLPMTPDKGSVK
jgi:hypothetical protein